MVKLGLEPRFVLVLSPGPELDGLVFSELGPRSRSLVAGGGFGFIRPSDYGVADCELSEQSLLVSIVLPPYHSIVCFSFIYCKIVGGKTYRNGRVQS